MGREVALGWAGTLGISWQGSCDACQETTPRLPLPSRDAAKYFLAGAKRAFGIERKTKTEKTKGLQLQLPVGKEDLRAPNLG